MRETSMQLLLAEYDRRKELELALLEHYERALQLHLTVITAAVGALLLLIEKPTASYSPFHSFALLLGAVLVVGEVTYLRLVGLDIRSLRNLRALQLIQERFFDIDPDLAQAFLKGPVQDRKMFQSWASSRGIITRALTRAQQKTFVALLNCLTTAALALVTVLSTTASVWVGLAVGLLASLLLGLLHVLYTSWRYKQARDKLFAAEAGYWL